MTDKIPELFSVPMADGERLLAEKVSGLLTPALADNISLAPITKLEADNLREELRSAVANFAKVQEHLSNLEREVATSKVQQLNTELSARLTAVETKLNELAKTLEPAAES
jgi:hypothetical protein